MFCDDLMIKTEANFEVTIINIPKQISKENIVQLMSLKWLTTLKIELNFLFLVRSILNYLVILYSHP